MGVYPINSVVNSKNYFGVRVFWQYVINTISTDTKPVYFPPVYIVFYIGAKCGKAFYREGAGSNTIDIVVAVDNNMNSCFDGGCKDFKSWLDILTDQRTDRLLKRRKKDFTNGFV